jgi:hypothetical protein
MADELGVGDAIQGGGDFPASGIEGMMALVDAEPGAEVDVKPEDKSEDKGDPKMDDKVEKPAENHDIEIPDDLIDPVQKEDAPVIDADDDPVDPEMQAAIDKAPVKTQEAFKAMRLTIKEQKKAIADAKNAAPVADPEQATKMAELETRIERADFIKSPRFAREHVAPIKAHQEQIVKAGEDYGISKQVMAQAFQLPRAERAELLGQEISNQNGLSDLLPMFSKHEQMMAGAKSAVEGYKATTQAEQQQAVTRNTEAMNSAVNDAVSVLQADGFTLLQDSKSNPEWLPGLKKQATAILAGQVSPADFAKAALSSVVSRHQVNHYMKKMQSMETELNETRTKLGKYVKLQPRAGGNATPAPATPTKATSMEGLVEETLK